MLQPCVPAALSDTSIASGPDREEAVFDFLSSVDWCESGCADSGGWEPPTCLHLRFLPTGTFRRGAFPDYLEADDEGDWNFDLETDSTGRVLMGGHSLFWFERHGEYLWLGGRRYEPCRRTKDAWGDARPGRRRLRRVDPPALFESLCGRDWLKEDDFDLFMTPQALHFDPDLRCELSFRNGQCKQTGRFSIERDHAVLEMQPPGCDSRGGENYYTGRTVGVAVVADTLTFGNALYAPRQRVRTLRRTRGLGNQGGLYLNLAYDGQLEAGSPTLLTIEFEYVVRWQGAPPVHLNEFRFALQRYRPNGNGFTPAGSRIASAKRHYGDRVVEPGHVVRDTVTVVPPIRGEYVCLMFEWDYRDTIQDYRSSAWPIVRVR